jgi:nucleotide-binding universal stress UspA family protein
MGHELARALDAELDVIAATGSNPRASGGTRSTPRSSESDAHEQTMTALKNALSDLMDGVSMRLVVVDGEAAPALIERSLDLELLVLGSRAYGPLRHALLGTVSSPVMRDARCPVLVLPRGAASGRRRRGLPQRTALEPPLSHAARSAT